MRTDRAQRMRRSWRCFPRCDASARSCILRNIFPRSSVMKKGRHSSIVAILLLVCGALRVDASPRQDVLEISKLIEATYFDPVRAKEIADKLREESKRGAFDQQRDPSDLAAIL